MHRRTFLGLAAALAAARIMPARAQSLAGKQIKLVVPFPAGGPTDIVARPFAQMLGEALKATIVVDNRGGAGGSIGADVVAKSPPDGTTLLIGSVGTNAINAALYARLPYDVVGDFTPLALIAQAPVAVVVHPSQPMKTLADLVALAKQNPGKLNFGSAGLGTPGHLTGEMFRAAAGIDIQHVPYKGSAPAVTDLVGGQIQLMFDPLQSVLSNIQGGKIRALAVSSRARSPVVPDVPDHCRVRLCRLRDHGVVGRIRAGQIAGCIDGVPRRRDRAHHGERKLPQQARAAWCHRPHDQRSGIRRLSEGRVRQMGQGGERRGRENRMKLNDEEQDILAGKAGPVPQLALTHQIKVGEFFDAADFVAGHAGPHHGRHRESRRSRRAMAGKPRRDIRRPA